MVDSISLYKKDSRGQIRSWSIEIEWDMECLLITHGVHGGEMQIKEEYIDEGKAGRDIEEQLQSRFNSRVNKKLDIGYSTSVEEAQKGTLNSLGFYPPMKAQPTVDKNLNPKKNILTVDWETAFIQRKYNGLRNLSINDYGNLVTYTRGSKRLDAIEHIRADLAELEHGVTLDGEIYHHCTPLQTINSWAKRHQPDTDKLIYVVYDIILDKPFSERFIILKDIVEGLGASVVLAETLKVNSFEQAMNYFQQFRDERYEGAIIRQGLEGYQPDKRPKNVLKLKAWDDSEFEVFEITESPRDGVAVLHMRAENGMEFRATAPGTFNEKMEVLRNKDEYIGLSVTIRFAERTVDGIPAQPVAVAWREKGE